MVVGSAASISRQQSEILAASSDVVTVRFSWGKVRTTNSESDQVVEALKRGSDTLVVFEGDEEFSVSQAQVFAEALSGLISPCAGLLGGLIATGGETARAVLDGLGIRRLRLLGEIEPGIPFSVAEGWTRPLPVVTKAGAFGSPTALVRCREFLCGLRSGAMTESQRLFNLAR